MKNDKTKKTNLIDSKILISSAMIILSSCNGGGGAASKSIIGFDVKADAAPAVAAQPTTWQKLLKITNPFPSAQAVPVESIFIDKALVTLSEIKFYGHCGSSNISSSSSSTSIGEAPIGKFASQSNSSESEQSSSAENESESENENESEECELEFNGPFEVDLMSTESSPLVSGLAPDADWYKIKWKTFKKEHGDDEDLSNRSFYLVATVDNVLVSFESAESYTFEINNLNGLASGEVESYRFEIPVKELLSNIDFSGLGSSIDVSESNPVPTLTSRCPSINNSASTLYECLADGIKQNTRERNDD